MTGLRAQKREYIFPLMMTHNKSSGKCSRFISLRSLSSAIQRGHVQIMVFDRKTYVNAH